MSQKGKEEDDAAPNIKLLEARIQAYFSRLQVIYDSSLNMKSNEARQKFLSRSSSVDTLRSEFSGIVEKLHVARMQADASYVPSFQAWDSFEELYSHIQHVRNGLTDKKSDIVSIQHKELKPNLKLPPIVLPTFDGDQKKFAAFIDCFNSTVHSNESLSNSEKVFYLCGQLSGKALASIAGIIPCGENYQLIYSTLVDKYEDVRQLGSSYLNELFNYKEQSVPSAKGLNDFIDCFVTAGAAFDKLKITNKKDFIFLYLALSKIDAETARMFENSMRSERLPTYDSFVVFIKEQAKILERRGDPNVAGSNQIARVQKSTSYNRFALTKRTQSFVSSTELIPPCSLCNSMHEHFYQCLEFKKISPRERYAFIKKNGCCVKCLSQKHRSANCRTSHVCENCSSNTHHSLLHFFDNTSTAMSTVSPTLSPNENTRIDSNTNCRCCGAPGLASAPATELSPSLPRAPCSVPVATDVQTAAAAQVSHNYLQANITAPAPFTVLLATARVVVTDCFGKNHFVRCLVDNGSQNHFITASCCKKLSLNYDSEEVPIIVNGFGGTTNKTKGKAYVKIHSQHDANIAYDVQPLVVDYVTSCLPTASIDVTSLTYLAGIPLADDTYHIPGEIDMLLGADLFCSLLMSGRIRGPPGSPDAVQTTLGFVLMGKAPLKVPPSVPKPVVLCAFTNAPLNKLVERFFETEEVPAVSHPYLSPDEQECEENYIATTTRDSSGRYSVALPFKSSPSTLGNSLCNAQKRFLSLEKRFNSAPSFQSAYNDVVGDYIEKGYLVAVEGELKDEGYVIPHHGVVRNDKISTKLRLVLDASSPTDNNVSLNSILNPGPNLQSDLFLVLLNFRLFPYAFCADVKQMYLQICVQPEFRKYQRILFRSTPSDSLQMFEFERVCFGLSASPYLALRTVKQLAIDEGSNYPLAAEVIKRGDFYMDDVATSAPSMANAVDTMSQLIDMFQAGGFELTKWSSNSRELLKVLPEEYLHPCNINFDDDSCQKVLGVKWDPCLDMFSFDINTNSGSCTKRNILSVVARLWDVLGFAAPVILYAKLLIKTLWLEKIDWDDIPPQVIIEAWKAFMRELPLLSQLTIPRYVGVIQDGKISILGFADASEKAYGSVLYVHVVKEEKVSIRFLCAKSKVAPVKTISLARLELCAAYLMSKLIRVVLDNYKGRIDISRVYAFSDSTVTLHWIHSSPHRWKTFVANRVAKIQQNLAADNFFHIPGKDNPSDCLSRGLTPSQLLNHPLWLQGPSWAQLDRSRWPIKPFINSTNNEIPEMKPTAFTVLSTVCSVEPILYGLAKRLSSFSKILRVSVYVLRFAKCLKTRGAITVEDMEYAKMTLIKELQSIYFSEDIESCREGRPCPTKAVRKLRPFILDGVLRVGGRLENSDLTFDHKHPCVLPRNDHIVKLIIDDTHRKNSHAGEQLLFSILRHHYWILSARRVVRSRVQACVPCFKARPKIASPPVMANLPKCRLQISKPFSHTGVDLCGPLNVTLVRRRGAKTQKMYVCVFICLSTRATHVEICSDLSTATFLNALKRFLSRRGPVDTLYSDNGTNFVGANSHLRNLLKDKNELSEAFANELLNHQIKWQFIVPNAPHWGGSWESAVKSFKTHLFRVIGSQILSYEELYTVLCQIEAVLNSRPLGLLSSDPSEPTPLTPAHFLNTLPLKSLPAAEICEERTHLLSRYQLLDQLVQSYWRRWSREYLHTLQTREKWNTESRPVTIGTVVLVMSDNAPPLHWPMGVILETYSGKDGAIRVALVKTKHGIYKRPVVKLCPLPSQQ